MLFRKSWTARAMVLASLIGLAAAAATMTQDAGARTTAPRAAGWKYAVIPPVVNVFYTTFPSAIEAASKAYHTGTVAYQLPQNFDQNEQNGILEGLVAKGYNLMAIQPSDPVAGNAEIAKLVARNVKVVTFGGCPEQPSKAPFCLSTDAKTAAYNGTLALLKALGGKGRIVHLSGQVADVNTAARIAGVKAAIAKYPGVKLVQTITDVDSPQAAQTAVASLFASKRSQIDGIITTAGNPSIAVAQKMMSLKETRIKAVTIDTEAPQINAIKAGYVYGTVAQNPFGMAYLSVYSLALLSEGYTWKPSAPFHVDSGTLFISKRNVAHWQSDIVKTTNQMVKTWKSKYFAK